jgi:hypothetical protein
VITMNVIHPGEVAEYVREIKDEAEKGTYRKVNNGVAPV